MQVKSIAECLKRASTILSTCIKVTYVFKTFILSIFEWPLKTGLLYFYYNYIYLKIFRGHGNWTTGMEKQWRKTDAVSRTVLHTNIPDLGRVYQHPFKAYRQAGHSVCM